MIIEGRHTHHPLRIFNFDKYLATLPKIYMLDNQQKALINIQDSQSLKDSNRQAEYSNFDDDQGVINALTAYVNTDERQKTDNLMDLYNLRQDNDDKGDDDELDQNQYLFPHL